MERYVVRFEHHEPPKPVRAEMEERLARKIDALRTCRANDVRRFRFRLRLYAAAIVATMLVINLLLMLRLHLNAPLLWPFLTLMPLVFLSLAYIRLGRHVREFWPMSAEARQAALAIVDEPDPRIAGLLATVHQSGDGALRELLAPVLRERLAQLRASDLSAFTADDLQAVLGLLRVPNLVLAALPAVAQLAPPGAMKEVRYVADHRAELLGGTRETTGPTEKGRAGKTFSERLEIELSRCLTALKDREAIDASRDRLLRPAEGAEPGRLLRPAGTSAGEQEQLLRPANEEAE